MKLHYKKIFLHFTIALTVLLGSMYFVSAYTIFNLLSLVNVFLFLSFILLFFLKKKNKNEEQNKTLKWSVKMFVITLSLEIIFSIINLFSADSPLKGVINELESYFPITDTVAGSEHDTLSNSEQTLYFDSANLSEYTNAMSVLNSHAEKMERALLKHISEKTDVNKIVVTYNVEDVKDMTPIDLITVQEKKAGAEQEILRNRALKRLKNEASDIGATKILIKMEKFSAEKENTLTLAGEIYR